MKIKRDIKGKVESSVGIDYHHIRNRDEERHTKKETSSNQSSECNTTFYNTYPLYKYNIGIDYNHIRNRMKRDIKRESQVIKVILDFITLTSYTITI